jgi:NADPH oxidase
MKCGYLNFLSPELSLIQFLVMALALSIVCALLCTLRKGAGGSGSNCQTVGVIVVLLGLRNNLNTIVFGISFERAIYFHKFAGMIFILSTAWHGYYALQGSTPSNFASGTSNLTGVILAFLVGGIGITYLVKNKNFELFYYLHMLMYCATIPVAFLHSAPIYAFSCIAWAIDLTLRYILARKSAVAVIDLLPADVIRITVPKPFEYTAGQYCFIMIPQLSWLEYHVSNMNIKKILEMVDLLLRV